MAHGDESVIRQHTKMQLKLCILNGGEALSIAVLRHYKPKAGQEEGVRATSRQLVPAAIRSRSQTMCSEFRASGHAL